MTDVRLSNEYYHLVYDPLIHGYTNSFFYTASGTPAISTNVLRFNAASCYTTGQFMHGEFEFGLNIPTPVDASLICGAAGSTDITVWDQITDGEFAITIDGVAYDVTGVDFSKGTYTPSFLTGGNAATSTIATWAAVTDGAFKITIDGTLRSITGINFKTALTYSPAYLTGGVAATSVPATWAAVANGEFAITIDGVAREITGIDFTGVTTMDEVATVIQSAIRAVTSGTETVIWSTDHFVISSSNTTVDSAITVTSTVAVPAGTDISGAGATNFLDSDVGNGVVTTKSTTKTMVDVASVIQAAVRAVTGSTETVAWSTNHFVVSSADTTSTSAITVASAPTGGTDISGVGATTFMDAETAVGVVTARAMADAMDYVASVLQTSIVVLTGSADTVTYDTDHFVFTTDNTNGVSTITVLSAVVGGSGTDISGAGLLNGLAGTGTVTVATIKEFGLKLPSFSGKSSILFQVFGNKLICRSYDSSGATEYTSIPWETSWSGAATSYKIIWLKDRVEFLVGGVLKTTLSEKLPNDISLSVYVRNADSNNQDLSYLYFKGIEKANQEFTNENVNVELNPGDIEIGAVELKNATTDDRASVQAANTARTTGTIVVATQNVGANGVATPSGASTDPIYVKDTTTGTDIVVLNTTGAAAINTTTAVAAEFKLLKVTCHFSAAPTTSENFVIKLDSIAGAAYDTTLFSINPSLSAATDLVYVPDGEMKFKTGDELLITFTNTNTKTYGLSVYYQLV